MAEEAQEGGAAEAPVKCPDCPPAGAPAWMATFSDLVTLLLTFFVLLYATSKQDSEKFKSVAGSIRKAFAGNSKSFGEVPQPGKSPDDSPTMIDSQSPVEPFPIDFLTTEGMLDKLEINRSSDENLGKMREILKDYSMSESVDIFEENEGIKVRLKDKLYFKPGSVEIDKVNAAVFQRLVKLVRKHDWTIFVEGFADKAEKSSLGDAYDISSKRAIMVAKSLIKRGIKPSKVTPVFYGDSRPAKLGSDRRVEFIIRKRDLRSKGKKVQAQ